jgi:hypothetical protein
LPHAERAYTISLAEPGIGSRGLQQLEQERESVVTSDEQIANLFHVVKNQREEHMGSIIHRKIKMYKIIFAFVSHLHVSWLRH